MTFLTFIFALDIWRAAVHTKETEQFKHACVGVTETQRPALMEIRCLYMDNVVVAVLLNYINFILI